MPIEFNFFALMTLPLSLCVGGVEYLILRKKNLIKPNKIPYVLIAALDFSLSFIIDKIIFWGWRLLLLKWAWSFRLATIKIDSWYQYLFVFLAADFLFYVMHRCSHFVPYWWAHHSVHHLARRLNLVTGSINGITSIISGLTFFFMPLVLLGVHYQIVLKCIVFIMVWQAWMHSEWFPRLGVLDKILVTPSNHRVHHLTNKGYMNANYGGVTAIFDHLFKTYKDEPSDVVLKFGVLDRKVSSNPIEYFWGGYRNLFARGTKDFKNN